VASVTLEGPRSAWSQNSSRESDSTLGHIRARLETVEFLFIRSILLIEFSEM